MNAPRRQGFVRQLFYVASTGGTDQNPRMTTLFQLVREPSVPSAATAGSRLFWLDLARGIAVLAMIVFHFGWDLSFNRFIAVDVNQDEGWRLFARCIAATFLALAGFSLWLAHRHGIRWPAFWRREGVIVAAAALVTLGSYFAFPDSYIFFGILHAIAAASLVGLAFLRLPALVTLAAALFCLLAPRYLSAPAFDAPLLAFLGLRTFPPTTNDYVPLFPWLAPFLLGVALGRLLPALSGDAARRAGASLGVLGRVLRWAGRNSLVIYLLHQPILFGATTLAAEWMKPGINDAEGEFLSACEANCVKQGSPREACIQFCFCTVDGLKKTGVFPAILKGARDKQTLDAITEMSRACQR